MKEIFISYSTHDITAAETVRDVLEKNELSCWMAPRDIPGGSNYSKEIPIAIRNCKVFLLILSKNAQASQWVLRELDSAVNCGKVILPFMLEDCMLNDEFNFLLTGAQRYAAYQKKAEAMENLIARIRSILDVPNAQTNEEKAEEIPQYDELKQKEKLNKKSIEINFGNPICSACKGSDLKKLPNRVKRQGLAEISTMLLIPIMGMLFLSIVFTIFAIISSVEVFTFLPLGLLLGFIAGALVGDKISKTIVKRKRIRKQIQAVCYRCNRCSKVFLYDEKLNNVL